MTLENREISPWKMLGLNCLGYETFLRRGCEERDAWQKGVRTCSGGRAARSSSGVRTKPQKSLEAQTMEGHTGKREERKDTFQRRSPTEHALDHPQVNSRDSHQGI